MSVWEKKRINYLVHGGKNTFTVMYIYEIASVTNGQSWFYKSTGEVLWYYVQHYGVGCNRGILGENLDGMTCDGWFTWLGSQRNHPINNDLDAKRNQERPKRDQAREESIFGIQSQDRVAAQVSWHQKRRSRCLQPSFAKNQPSDA